MPERVTVLPAADADLDDLFAYLLPESPTAAFKFLAAADKTFESLLKHPNIGFRRESKNPDLKDMRTFPVKGFPKLIVFYRPTENGIEVIRILHGARDLLAVLEEEP